MEQEGNGNIINHDSAQFLGSAATSGTLKWNIENSLICLHKWYLFNCLRLNLHKMWSCDLLLFCMHFYSCSKTEANQEAVLGWKPISICNSLAEKGNSSAAMTLILSHIQLWNGEGLTWILLKEKYLYKKRENEMQEEKANGYAFARLDNFWFLSCFRTENPLPDLTSLWKELCIVRNTIFQILRCCYICWGHNFLFLSGPALPAYQMDDAAVKRMCGFGYLLLRKPQSKAGIFSRLPFVYHFASQWEESYCWKNTSGCLMEWLICCLSLLTG